MEAQLEREEAGFHSVEEGKGGEREKKSVLKKVKEKAKKIKNTIKKHAHVHDDDAIHHEVGGSSMYESTVIRSKTLPRDDENNLIKDEEARHSCNKAELENEDPPNINTPHLHRCHNLNNNDDDDEFEEEESSAACSVVDKVKNVVASTFTPGDEDKALSEVITGALRHDHNQKTKTQPQRGKVTMSKEVAERLGPAEGCKREGEDALAAGEESSGKELTVTDKIQDAFTSWLGKSDGIQTAQDSIGNAFVNNSETSGANVETHRAEECSKYMVT